MFSRIKNINMSTGFFIPSPAICLSGRTWDGWGVKNLNVGNCDDAPSTAGSRNYYYCYCYCFCYCYCYYFRGTCARWERLLSWGTGNGAGVQFVILLYTFCFWLVTVLLMGFLFSAENLCKQFGPRSRLTECMNPNCLTL